MAQTHKIKKHLPKDSKKGQGHRGVEETHSTTEAVKAVDIHKYYKNGPNQLHVLKGVSLTINYGDFISIMGPSVSGKSTLMHILGLLDKFDSGKLFIDGKDVSKLSDAELAQFRGKKIGFVFQNFYLLNKYTVLDNVLLPTEYIYIPNAKQRAIQILKDLGLGERLYHRPNELSGGQRQRVAIARALLPNPTIILADEPTGNLDSKTGKTIMELFTKLNREGKTIVIITHDPEIARWTHKTIMLKDGEIISESHKNDRTNKDKDI